jgi:Tol biopolymer transport system component
MGDHRRLLCAIAGSLLITGCAAAPSPSPSVVSPVVATASPASVTPTAAVTVSPTPSASASSIVPLDDAPWIMYQRLTGAGGGIFLMHLDGTGLHEVASDVAGTLKHPDWSPDGEKIVFVVEDDNSIWVVGADGSDAHRLPICDNDCDYPAWSPDGSRIAFSRWENVDGVAGPSALGIYVLDLASGKVTKVARAERPLLYDVPRWSPDGSRILLGVDQMDDDAFETGAAVGIVPATGGQVRLLTKLDRFAYSPDESKASGTIVVSLIVGAKKALDPDDETQDIYTLRPDGTDLAQLTHIDKGKHLRHASWSPDGSQILAAYEEPAIGVFVDPKTGTVTEFGGEQVAHPHLRP